jgi:hypothetical protein
MQESRGINTLQDKQSNAKQLQPACTPISNHVLPVSTTLSFLIILASPTTFQMQISFR